MIFARIIKVNGSNYPLGYEPYVKGYKNKKLLFPIPGVYSASVLNPMSR